MHQHIHCLVSKEHIGTFLTSSNRLSSHFMRPLVPSLQDKAASCQQLVPGSFLNSWKRLLGPDYVLDSIPIPVMLQDRKHHDWRSHATRVLAFFRLVCWTIQCYWKKIQSDSVLLKKNALSCFTSCWNGNFCRNLCFNEFPFSDQHQTAVLSFLVFISGLQYFMVSSSLASFVSNIVPERSQFWFFWLAVQSLPSLCGSLQCHQSVTLMTISPFRQICESFLFLLMLSFPCLN